MTRPSVKEQPFVGQEAYLAQRSAPPCAVLCTLTVDDHRSASGQLRYMLGGEPILTRAGEPLVDAKGRPSYVTSAGSGPSVGKHLLMAYLPPEQAVAGTRLTVEYLGEPYPVTVAVAGLDAAVRPGERAGQELSAMEILVCVKRVPMVGGKIVVTADGQDVDTRMSGFTVSPHEECAVEEAVRLVERHGGTVDGAHARPARRRRPAAGHAGARGLPRGAAGDRRPGMGPDRDRRGDRAAAAAGAERRADARPLRPAAVRQRGGRHR